MSDQFGRHGDDDSEGWRPSDGWQPSGDPQPSDPGQPPRSDSPYGNYGTPPGQGPGPFGPGGNEWEDRGGYGQFGAASGNYSRAPYGGHSNSPIPLHPLTVAEQLDAAVRLLRFNPASLMGLPLLVWLANSVLIMVIGLIIGETQVVVTFDTLSIPGPFIAYIVVSLVLSYAAGSFTYITGTNTAMSAVYGNRVSMGQVTKMSLADLPRFIGAFLVYFVVLMAAVFALAWVPYAVLPNSDSFLYVVLDFAILALTVYLAVRLSATVPALVAEQLGPFAAIRRSFELTRSKFAFIFSTLVLLVVTMFAISLVIGLVLGIALSVLQSVGLYSVLNLLSTVVVTAFVVPWVSAVSNVIYINMRMTKESFHYSVLGIED